MKHFFLLKKNLTIGVIFVFTVISLVIQSCKSDNWSYLPTTSKNITKSVGPAFTSWEAELSQGIKFSMERLLQQGLSLTSYELRNETISVAALETNQITADTKIPIYDDPDNENGFTLQTFGALSEELRESYSQYKVSLFKICTAKNVQIVVMTWRYKGRTFKTECYVTNEQIIYDPIISHIRFVSYSNIPIIAPIPIIKPQSEPGTTYKLSQNYSNSVCFDSFGGVILASASVNVVLQGNTDAEGRKCVENFIAETPYSAVPLFGANGVVKVNSFETGPNGYIEFEYAIGVSGPSCSVSFDYAPGIGFTIPTGVNGKTGVIRINASELR